MKLITALITPFKKNNSIFPDIDFNAIKFLMEIQFNAGIRDIVIMGSTGEGHSFAMQERQQMINFCLDIANNFSEKVNIIVSINSNITKFAIDQVKQAENADSVMIASPYYNKPCDLGLYKHFSEIAQSTKLPIMLYDIPGRSCISLSIELINKLFNDHANIISVKESTNDLSKINKILHYFSKKVFCGDDGAILSFAAQNAGGIVSVISNLIPDEMVKLCNLIQLGNFKEVNALYNDIFLLIEKVFLDINPIGIKRAISEKYDFIDPIFRSPLCF